ncbi:MAG: DUF3592 domain-containing protein [Anaerolineales bacterium]|jgi:hypothetical protein|nr:DUF3592 domain-containing protein [Anaerolineales bacterium]MBK8822123.1 DUF3592 domain-containing protein [Anaerolineales bacterium]
MDNLNWIITGIGVFAGIAGVVCSIIIPILVIGGIGFFFYKRNQKSTAYRQTAQTWPAVTGTVLMSTIQSKRIGQSHKTYPVVIYQYVVNGQGFQGQTIRAGEQFLSARVAGQPQATVARYPVGASVPVYYNPANPAESVLER